MTAEPFDWPLFLRQLDAREHYWNSRRITYARQDAVPFMPYSMPLFAALLYDAVMALPGDASYTADATPCAAKFLDVGCGPGTKIALAEALFDLDVHGIDLVPEFIAEARDWGLSAEVRDAFDFKDYAEFDIVLVNRPSGLQDEMESLIMDSMKPGALLIAINWRCDPGTKQWQCISQEWGEPVRGVWAKPDGTVHAVGKVLTGPTACCGKLPASLPSGDSLTPDLPLVTCRAHPDLGLTEDLVPLTYRGKQVGTAIPSVVTARGVSFTAQIEGTSAAVPKAEIVTGPMVLHGLTGDAVQEYDDQDRPVVNDD